jgi:NTE family protein
MNANHPLHQTALLLPGGGARAAYQVGVLKGLAELFAERTCNPFPILSGTSAGALNAVALATHADDFGAAARWLESLWLALSAQRVYHTGWLQLARNTLRLLLSLFNAGIAVGAPVALLDNSPLRALLQEVLDFDRIATHIQHGHLRAISVTAMNYNQGMSVSFFQGGPSHAAWQRWRRQGIAGPLQLEHLMASTAIPTIFPPERIGQYYYGDGALRQLSPISPALHLGASRVLIVPPNGHGRRYSKPIRKIQSPAFGQIIGNLLNSAFIDSLESDIERMDRLNEMLRLLTPEQLAQLPRTLEPIDFYVIAPSQDIDTIAELHVRELPCSIRAFLRVTGSNRYNGGVNAASYLLFTHSFIKQLIELGHGDVMADKTGIANFMLGAGTTMAAADGAASLRGA